MSGPTFDLVIIGGGSAGLTGARFAARLGASVAIAEKHRLGGDCTWTGCVPSKALLRAARLAHDARRGAAFGVEAGPVRVDMSKVRDHVRGAIARVYAEETPEILASQGVQVFFGAASFVAPRTLQVGDQTLSARRFIIATGASPARPAIPGLAGVPHDTHETIFDNDRLPRHLLVVGAGPVGVELAQAYRRLGAEVTVIAEAILPREEPETRDEVKKIFAAEGVRIFTAKITGARQEGDLLVLDTDNGEVRGDRLLIAAGRQPNVRGLGLDLAGVNHSDQGVQVDDSLRTTAPHIYAAGDVLGGPQFTHLAGWQCFQAVRNALLPGNARGTPELLPAVTFTDPEIARVGPTEAELRSRLGDQLRVHLRPMHREDRAVCEGEERGFIKALTTPGGVLLGSTIVAPHAGEMIAEFTLALQGRLTLAELAATSHAYPTWSMAVQQLASEVALADFLGGTAGKLAARVGRWLR